MEVSERREEDICVECVLTADALKKTRGVRNFDRRNARRVLSIGTSRTSMFLGRGALMEGERGRVVT